MEHERRRRVIEESKYLGGDIAHTHLVKGLDYALLEKVRSEIAIKSAHGQHDAASGSKKDDSKPEGEGAAPDLITSANAHFYLLLLFIVCIADDYMVDDDDVL